MSYVIKNEREFLFSRKVFQFFVYSIRSFSYFRRPYVVAAVFFRSKTYPLSCTVASLGKIHSSSQWGVINRSPSVSIDEKYMFLLPPLNDNCNYHVENQFATLLISEIIQQWKWSRLKKRKVRCRRYSYTCKHSKRIMQIIQSRLFNSRHPTLLVRKAIGGLMTIYKPTYLPRVAIIGYSSDFGNGNYRVCICHHMPRLSSLKPW